MVIISHHFNNMGFKSVYSSKHKEKMIAENKKGFKYARLGKVEFKSIVMSGESIQGVLLFSSLDSSKNGFSFIHVKDDAVVDFLLFGDMVILQTRDTVFGFDWTREEMVFKKKINHWAEIRLIEPSLIVESNGFNNLILNPFDANEVVDDFEGCLVDGYSEHGQIVLLYTLFDSNRTLSKLCMGYYDVKNNCFKSKLELQVKEFIEGLSYKVDLTDYRVGKNLHEEMRILGFSFEKDCFYICFLGLLILVNMKDKSQNILSEIGKSLKYVKVVPEIYVADGGPPYDYLIIRDGTYSDYTKYFGMIVDEDGFYADEQFELTDIHHDSALSKSDVLDERNWFFKDKGNIVRPIGYREVKNGVREYTHSFVSAYQFDKQIRRRNILGFIENGLFSYQNVKNNRLVKFPSDYPVEKAIEKALDKAIEKAPEKEFEKELEIETPKEEISEIQKDILSLYHVPLIQEEDREMMKRLMNQDGWLLPTCRAEREMITIILPDLLTKYKVNEEKVCADGIEEILGLLRSIHKKKQDLQTDKYATDVKFAVDYAKSLL